MHSGGEVVPKAPSSLSGNAAAQQQQQQRVQRFLRGGNSGYGQQPLEMPHLDKKPQLLTQMEVMLKSWTEDLGVIDVDGLAGREGEAGFLHETPEVKAAAANSKNRSRALLSAKVARLETARSAMYLYQSGSGQFKEVLKRLFDYVFDVIDAQADAITEDSEGQAPKGIPEDAAMVTASRVEAQEKLAEQLDDLDAQLAALATIGGNETQPAGKSGGKAVGTTGNGLESSAKQQSGTALAARIGNPHLAAKYQMMYTKVENVRDQMRTLVKRVEIEREQHTKDMSTLKTEKQQLEQVIEYQAQKQRRGRIQDMGSHRGSQGMSARDVLHSIKDEMLVDSMRQELNDAINELDAMKSKCVQLKELNMKYAIQAVELGARMKVYHENNERFSSSLALQMDERIALEKENEALQKALQEAKQRVMVGDLEGDISEANITRCSLRGVRHGLGASSLVPKHLHQNGMLPRIPCSKEAALSAVREILLQRNASAAAAPPTEKKSDFAQFLAGYFQRKHNDDASAYAYSLDEACQRNDADHNLNLFWYVSRRMVGESIYKTIHRDICIFLTACEAVDEMQHGHKTLRIHVEHVFLVLLEMYPRYTNVMLDKLIHLALDVSASRHLIFYHMLFPNYEVQTVVTDSTSVVWGQQDTLFYRMFRELVVDDTMQTMLAVGDGIVQFPGERVTLADVAPVVSRTLFGQAPDETIEVTRTLAEALNVTTNDAAVLKLTVLSAFQSRCALRRGNLPGGKPISGVSQSWRNELTDAEEIPTFPYKDIVAQARDAFFDEADDGDA